MPADAVPDDGPDSTPDAEAASTDDVGPDAASTPDQPLDADDAPDEAVVEARLADSLERVAHGATVSVPGILAERGLAVAFTAVVTNGFGGAAYGVFALARRSQAYLLHLALGFRSGLSRYLPNADDDAERDALVSVACALLLAVAGAFGVALYVAAPTIARLSDVGATAQFQTLLRAFALGLPAMAWLYTVGEILRGLEEVAALNVSLRLGFPLVQLGVGVLGTLLFDDLVLVAVGVVATGALAGVVTMAWLARARGVRPRLRAPGVRDVLRRYLAFTLPLFASGFATVTQRLGFYPLIAWFLSGLAGGVFAVGVLVGSLVRLPLMAINQFIPPVAAELNDSGHDRALARLYQVTSRIVLVGVTAVAVPVVVHRRSVMAVFGDAFVPYAGLLAGFVVAQYVACAAGSVGILMTMTDNQRAFLVVNVVVTTVLVVVAIPLTIAYGLSGLVATYVLMLSLNNGLEVVVLYYLEGLQPLTRRHGFTLIAAVPLAALALAGRELGGNELVPAGVGVLAGTAIGFLAYALTLKRLGFTDVERRLVATLVDRYRDVLSRHRTTHR